MAEADASPHRSGGFTLCPPPPPPPPPCIALQRLSKGSLGDLVGATLRLLERSGGSDAFAHIKYHVRAWEQGWHCLRRSAAADWVTIGWGKSLLAPLLAPGARGACRGT